MRCGGLPQKNFFGKRPLKKTIFVVVINLYVEKEKLIHNFPVSCCMPVRQC